MGLFVRDCVETTDWVEKNDNVSYSEKLGAFLSEYKGENRWKEL